MSFSKFQLLSILKFVIWFVVTLSFSQNKKASISVITYKVKVIDSIENYDLDDQIKRKIQSINETTKLLECKLEFNSEKSIFYQVNKITLDNVRSYEIASTFVRGQFYNSIADSVKILNKNFSDRTYNVIIPWNKHEWKLTNQFKKIGKYECQKADLVNSVILLTAWFTAEIPVPFGPNGIDGLPGLILETNVNDKLFFYATYLDLELETNDDKAINKPYADKTLSEKEFLKLASRKLEDVLKDY